MTEQEKLYSDKIYYGVSVEYLQDDGSIIRLDPTKVKYNNHLQEFKKYHLCKLWKLKDNLYNKVVEITEKK